MRHGTVGFRFNMEVGSVRLAWGVVTFRSDVQPVSGNGACEGIRRKERRIRDRMRGMG